MCRHFFALLFCITLICCHKRSPIPLVVEQSFPIATGNHDVLLDIRSLANEALAWEANIQSSKEQGWNKYKSTGNALTALPTFKDRNEEVDYFGGIIFQSLGYPLHESLGANFSVNTRQEAVIRHRKEALLKFEKLLERWRRTPEEKYNDMINGKP